MCITGTIFVIQKYKVLTFGFVLGITKISPVFKENTAFHPTELPFLFKSILQHFDPPHKIFLQIFLTFSFPLKEGNLGLSREKKKKKTKLSLDQTKKVFNSAEERTLGR